MKNEFLAALKAATKLEWRLEKSGPDTIVFYQLSAGQEPLQRLVERLAKVTKPMLLVLSRRPETQLNVPHLVMSGDEWTEGLITACDRFFPLPAHLSLLAVTGTNGKSTTVDLTLQLAAQVGLKGFSIGTLGVRAEGKTHEEFGLTTPGPIQLRQLLHAYGQSRSFCVMETSSHAIDQGRIAGLGFAAAAWTSFSQDHLDYHKTMENYFQAKSQILKFLRPGARLFVPHTQTELLHRLASSPQLSPTRVFAAEIRKLLPPFFGAVFNLENLACARELITTIGADESKFDWSRLTPPPGRFHVTAWNQRMAIVDFAHTPDALENICRAIRQSYPRQRLIVLFGCGGDRDRTKRPLMGQAVAKWADQIILTSDNPRSEDPDRIIQDIEDGIKGFSPLIKDSQRPRALQAALSKLQENEILLVAGKGHEDYIQIGQQKLPYSDQGEIDRFLEGNRHG